jgi:hypothetical protein
MRQTMADRQRVYFSLDPGDKKIKEYLRFQKK